MKYKNRFKQEAKPMATQEEFYALMCKSSFGKRIIIILKGSEYERMVLSAIYSHSIKTCSIKKNLYHRIHSVCRTMYCKVKDKKDVNTQRQSLNQIAYNIKLKEN
ncbi:hypothetical protein [Flammeovirga aprica]|uniref:Uncharacterized protein n=1 Tax=Flammeovirga aprica JL-4 TaxID=694437 RepID=A0A7X9P0X1_9BACT|nr:hypothetical protein [Flammeovirga aprica]NME66614.1 hypothetical protein [Flammeovirga aprica JL-4]